MSSGKRRACCECDDRCVVGGACPPDNLLVTFIGLDSFVCDGCNQLRKFGDSYRTSIASNTSSALNKSFLLRKLLVTATDREDLPANREWYALNTNFDTNVFRETWNENRIRCAGVPSSSGFLESRRHIPDGPIGYQFLVEIMTNCSAVTRIWLELDTFYVFYAAGSFPIGSNIDNQLICGPPLDTEPLLPSRAAFEGGIARVDPVFEPASLTMTINSDGTNCTVCHDYPGGVDAQTVTWDAPGTYTLNFVSADPDCVTFTYESSAFNWGDVNLFTDGGGCAIGAGSETVNGKITAVIRFDSIIDPNTALERQGWIVESVTGPSDIIKSTPAFGFAQGTFLGDTDIPAEVTVCGSTTDKRLRLNYTYDIDIKDFV